jgi:membrane protein implicated in regulation of membrane protease activity
MSWSDIYLLCFAIGSLWSLAALLLGGAHPSHGGHAHVGHGHGVHMHGHAHAGHDFGWFTSMLNPSCFAIFLAWAGGVGYLLTRHSGLAFWVDLALALIVGLAGAWVLGSFLHFLQSREKPMDPTDYEMIGTLGKVSSRIRPDGVGEVIYTQDGARSLVPARSEDGIEIRADEEVVVVRYEKGIAYVRTWDAMTRLGSVARSPEALQKETRNVE